MQVNYLKRQDIDLEQWNNLAKHSTTACAFMESYFLDIVCQKNWAAFVLVQNDKYVAALPVFPKKTLGMWTSRQPFFSKYWSPLYDNQAVQTHSYWQNWNKINALLYDEANKLFKWFIHTSVLQMPYPQALIFEKQFKLNPLFSQVLSLENKTIDDLRNAYYKSTRKRVLKLQEEGYVIEEVFSAESLDHVLSENASKEREIITKAQQKAVVLYVDEFLNQQKGFAINLLEKSGTLAAAGFFIMDKKRCYFLNGYVMPQFRKEGVMALLVDAALSRCLEKVSTFDFFGSNMASIETFFRGFGSTTEVYFGIKKAEFPFNLYS